MGGSSAGHGDGLKTIELVAQFLPFFPDAELLSCPGTLQSDVMNASLARGGPF